MPRVPIARENPLYQPFPRPSQRHHWQFRQSRRKHASSRIFSTPHNSSQRKACTTQQGGYQGHGGQTNAARGGIGQANCGQGNLVATRQRRRDGGRKDGPGWMPASPHGFPCPQFACLRNRRRGHAEPHRWAARVFWPIKVETEVIHRIQ